MELHLSKYRRVSNEDDDDDNIVASASLHQTDTPLWALMSHRMELTDLIR